MKTHDVESVVLYGRDYQSIDQVVCKAVADDQIAIGISVGTSLKPNEDCVGVTRRDNEVLLAITDGHWGREASEEAMDKAMAFLSSNSRPPVDIKEARARLYMLFEQVNRAILDNALKEPGAGVPETTLIVCYMRDGKEGKQLVWASFGDSYLFLQRGDSIRQLNTLNQFWLGAYSKLADYNGTEGMQVKYPHYQRHYVGVAAGLECGEEELGRDDILVLGTDGLVDTEGYSRKSRFVEFASILSITKSAEDQVRELITSAIRCKTKDNVACIVAQI